SADHESEVARRRTAHRPAFRCARQNIEDACAILAVLRQWRPQSRPQFLARRARAHVPVGKTAKKLQRVIVRALQECIINKLPHTRSMYTISTDKSRLDVDMIHRFLTEEAYWARNIPRDVVERSIENSICFGAYEGEHQVGFARVVTDCAIFAYVGDVFVLPAHRGR